MPRPVKLDGTDEDTKLLGALVHWVMCNNLLTILNKYPAIQASRDFDVSYAKLKRVITGKKQPGGLYYERQRQEQEGEETQKWGKKCKAVNPVDAALAKEKKVTLSVDTTECKYCGKLYHTGKKLTEHINQEHPGEQTIYTCPYCTQPFNQYSEYLQHLGEHKDRIIRCRICNKEFKTITRLRVHTKTHVNQCPFCSKNFLNPQALQDHVKENHGADPGAVGRQCSLCEFTCNSISELAEHNQSVHQRRNFVKKCFVKQADCDNHVRDVHKFVCRISGCSVFKYNEIELHEHLRYDHRPKMVFRCNKCVKVFSTRSELHQHHEVDHGRVKLAEVQGEKYPYPRCTREFLSESMLVSHSRDHKENVYGCNECLWHFNTVAGLIKHCQDTHDDRHFACTTCGEVFASNTDLCRHSQSHHVKLCHLCHRIFVSDDKLFAHMSEIHLGSTVHTREEMIEDEQA